MPSVDNGNYAGCNEGSAVDVGTQCTVSCETNYSPSTASVSCISAGSLNQLPECTGRSLLRKVNKLNTFIL